MGIGDWGLGIGDWAQSPIPNPQSPNKTFYTSTLINRESILYLTLVNALSLLYLNNKIKMSSKVVSLNELKINIFTGTSDIVEDKKIGAGGFGKVMSGYFKSLNCAIKILKDFSMEEFLREVRLLILFKHNYIPLLYGIVIKRNPKCETIKSVNLVNELIQGDTFDKYLKQVNPHQVEVLIHLIDLATVLTYLHSFRLIHRDLKPSNVMIDKELNIKLLDFGISKMTKNTQTITNTVGTILYMAPENFTAELTAKTGVEESKSAITTKVDVWAFGCMVSEIFSLHKPWAPAVKNDGIIMGMLFSKREFYIPPSLQDEGVVNLIKECTKVDHNNRINMKTVRDRLIDLLYEKIRCSTYLKDEIKQKDESLRVVILRKIKYYLSEKASCRKIKLDKKDNETKTDFSTNASSFFFQEEDSLIGSTSTTANTKEMKKAITKNTNRFDKTASKGAKMKKAPEVSDLSKSFVHGVEEEENNVPKKEFPKKAIKKQPLKSQYSLDADYGEDNFSK